MLFLDKYESLGVLSRGSMSQVHAARPIDDPESTVVVKVMRSDLADTPRAKQFFEREVKYTGRLRHSYVVRILDAGIDPAEGPCIVMEFVPGSTLEQVLKRQRRLTVYRTAMLAGYLCHALEAAHQATVIHRDLKPANLMVMNEGTSQEQLKVMDFGLAHLASKPFLSRERLRGTAVVTAQGTPAYISPEQLRGDDVDGRADLYSTGVILFEALTGRVPFSQSALAALVEAHLHQPPPAFADLGVNDVPEGVEAIVRQCLAKFPGERPASARAVAEVLGRAIEVDLWVQTKPAVEAPAEDPFPLADEIPAGSTVDDPNILVRTAEAWMPDRIAVIKLGGFLQDLGAAVVNTQPGLLQAQLRPRPPKKQWKIVRMFQGPPPPAPVVDGIDLDLNMHKPNPAESRLVVTVIFRCPDGAPKDPLTWTERCQIIFEEMRRYLMVGG
jgi:eukaryotic-like serine/threonine-protein kinase